MIRQVYNNPYHFRVELKTGGRQVRIDRGQQTNALHVYPTQPRIIHHGIKLFLLAFIFVLAAPIAGWSQSSHPGSLLIAMFLPDGCTRWEFHGRQTTANWPNGSIGDLTLDQFPQTETGKVVIKRSDPSGKFSGLNGTFTGTRKGPVIEGLLQWSARGHPERTNLWTAVILSDPIHMVAAAAETFKSIPPSITSCEDGHGCSLWTLNGKDGSIPGLATLSVERFDDSLIAIRRHELSGALPGLEALYVGIRKGDRADGLAIWKWRGDQVGELGWHVSLPSSNVVAETAQPSTPPAPITLEKLVDVVKPGETLKEELPTPAELLDSRLVTRKTLGPYQGCPVHGAGTCGAVSRGSFDRAV